MRSIGFALVAISCIAGCATGFLTPSQADEYVRLRGYDGHRH